MARRQAGEPSSLAKRAGSRKTVSAANLADLGEARLAEILMDLAEADPAVKRRLRLELAGEAGPEDLAAEVSKRLTAIETRRSRVHWRKYKDFVRDLDLQRAMIAGKMAEQSPALAVTFLWRFLAMSEGVFDLTRDDKGEVEAAFRTAVEDLGRVAVGSGVPGVQLAEEAFRAMEADEVLITARLVEVLLPALDAAGVARLRGLLTERLARKGRPRLGFRVAIQQLADAQGDVDGYIATLAASEVLQPLIGAGIASRLTAAGRAPEALAALKQSAPPAYADLARSPSRVVTSSVGLVVWEEAYLQALEADGQGELAQTVRWLGFEQRLSPDLLRAYLKRLADFDDVVAEDKAMAHVAGTPSFIDALRFFMAWPALSQAAALILARPSEIVEDDDESLQDAAAALQGRYPLAATLLYRALIAVMLRQGRRSWYPKAATWMAECEAMVQLIGDYGAFESHAEFVRKTGPIPSF